MVKVTASEGSYEASDIGNSKNSVIIDTIETTRHADGHISVDGMIWAKTRTVGDAVASGNSTWVEGLKFGAGINPLAKVT